MTGVCPSVPPGPQAACQYLEKVGRRQVPVRGVDPAGALFHPPVVGENQGVFQAAILTLNIRFRFPPIRRAGIVEGYVHEWGESYNMEENENCR